MKTNDVVSQIGLTIVVEEEETGKSSLSKTTEEKYMKKREQITNREVQKLLFEKYLDKCNNLRSGNAVITGFFKSV